MPEYNSPSSFAAFCRSERLRPFKFGRLFGVVLVALVLSLGCWGELTSAQEAASPAAQLESGNLGVEAKQTCLVVCPPAFRQAIRAWVKHREQQGFAVELVPTAPSAEETKRELLLAGLSRETAAIVLVGDCRITAAEAADTSLETPTFYRLPGPSAKFGTTDTLAGDAPYGDLDRDGIPDVPVGRLSVDNAGQLGGLVERIIAYETSSDFGDWRDTVQITAGVGGFGLLADKAIESATRSVLTTAVPESVRLCVTYCSPSSDFNPGPNDFFPAVLRRYREGGLFWVYMGHGQITELDRVPGPGGSRRPVLARADVPLLERPAAGAPIAVMLACYTGAFDASVDCLAEEMLVSPGGPIAVLAGSRVTMPYGNAIAAQGLINAVYNDRSQRLGQAWLAAQRELATDASDNESIAERRRLVDMLATAVSPAADMLPEERLEHVHLYNLLGDPLLKLHHPGEVVLDVPSGVTPGEQFTVRGSAPHSGDLVISVRHLPGNVPIERSLSRIERYEQANEGQVASVELKSQAAGPFTASFVLPEHLRGPMHVVARLQNHREWSVGAKRVLVRPESSSQQRVSSSQR